MVGARVDAQGGQPLGARRRGGAGLDIRGRTQALEPKHGGVASALNDIDAHSGRTDAELTRVAALVLGEQAQNTDVIGRAQRL